MRTKTFEERLRYEAIDLKRHIEAELVELKKNNELFAKDEKFIDHFPTYTKSEVKEIWYSALKTGLERGSRINSFSGQKIELFDYNNIKPNQKEFLEKFYALCNEYNCAIAYQPLVGMCTVDLK